MAKFSGKIGFVEYIETRPGYDDEIAFERHYVGDVIRNTRRWESGDQINDNVTLSNQFSIVADAYANEHYSAIRYILWRGTRWKITSIDIQRPRLILTIGGVYNGIIPGPSADA